MDESIIASFAAASSALKTSVDRKDFDFASAECNMGLFSRGWDEVALAASPC